MLSLKRSGSLKRVPASLFVLLIVRFEIVWDDSSTVGDALQVSKMDVGKANSVLQNILLNTGFSADVANSNSINRFYVFIDPLLSGFPEMSCIFFNNEFIEK
jgi:hypothetical protein